MITGRFRLAALLSLAALVTGCDHAGKHPDAPVRITYSHSGCFGTCPVFTVEADRSGHGTFDGKAYTAVLGKRAFSVTPRQFQSFAAALQPARQIAKPFNPHKSLQEQIDSDFASWCPPTVPQWTDDTGVIVIWSGSESLYLDAYFGCDPDRKREFYRALDGAPNILGLKKMIGGPEAPK